MCIKDPLVPFTLVLDILNILTCLQFPNSAEYPLRDPPYKPIGISSHSVAFLHYVYMVHYSRPGS